MIPLAGIPDETLSRVVRCAREDCQWRWLQSGYIRCDQCGAGLTPEGQDRVRRTFGPIPPVA